MPIRRRARKGAPGIVDVANRAGVSPASVSRFFNNPEMVKGPTRKRIETAANDLGYIRDRMAGAMHNRFSGTIGLVVPTIDNAIFAELIQAFAAQLLTHDRTMLIAAHGYDLDQEVAIVRSLLERRTDGVALVGFDHHPIALNMLQQRDVPAISIWNYNESTDLPCIGADNFEAGRLITGHLLDLGHKNVAFIFPETTSNDRARDRLRGAYFAIDEAGLTANDFKVHTCPYDVGAAKVLAKEVFSFNQPTAVICGNDIISHGVMYACNAIGLRVPEDVSIVGIGDFRGSAHMEPALTTIRLPAKKIGALAADALVAMNNTGTDLNPRHKKIELRLMDRGSTTAL